MAFSHLPALIAASVHTHPDQRALSLPAGESGTQLTYAQMWARARHLGVALRRCGVGKGDRVGIFGGNSPEWTLVDLALLQVGAISVTLYQTSSAAQVRHILNDSEAVLAFVGGNSEADRLAQVRAEIPTLRDVVGLSDLEAFHGPEPTAEELSDLDACTAQLAEDDLFTIIYTSGTTGEPKGACLSHGNMLAQVAAIHQLYRLEPGMRSMCFLPLSHAYERGWTYVVLSCGVENVYVTDPRSVADAMVTIRPDVFCSVPRLYEKVFTVAQDMAGDGPRRRLFDRAVAIGLATQRRIRQGRPVPTYLSLANGLADRMVLHHVRDAVGGRKAVMACGGAPLRREVVEFFLAAGLDIYEGYGLTETSPMVSCNAPGRTKIGSAGKPIPGCEVRIADDGEIHVRGTNVCHGYWKRPDLTEESWTDGWFRTGDVGHLDQDGYLYITDRIKDLIITAQGKNVAPGPIESALSADPLIASAVIVGDDRRYLVALIEPDVETLQRLARDRGWPEEDLPTLIERDEVKETYAALIRAVGAEAAPYEQIKRFRLLPAPLTMGSGDLTPTLKVRRRAVEEHYLHLIEEMYAEPR
ncbi:Long-chain-fatty-acid--CoA ligase FadD15 [Austwickia sp. TVS 96-490-7B]|nr:Long-chain-fatty-acid--CoA ligase FadD15 [Austwickia sp. TVS 96-490-7B]